MISRSVISVLRPHPNLLLRSPLRNQQQRDQLRQISAEFQVINFIIVNQSIASLRFYKSINFMSLNNLTIDLYFKREVG